MGGSLTNNTINRLKAWYLRTFLPFEMEDHPLHSPKYEEPDLSDWDDLSDAPYQIEYTISSDPNTKHRI